MSKKTVGTSGKYGPRYGTRTKKIVAAIESIQKKPQECPYCERPALKRLAAGIWHCTKCNKKFAGGAYFAKYAVSREVASAIVPQKVKAPEMEKTAESVGQKENI